MLRYLSQPTGPAGAALFVDRDGILNRRVEGGYVTRPEQFELLSAALPSLRAASDAHVPIVVVTNQGCIGRGLATPGDVWRVHARLLDELLAHGLAPDAIYICPHHPAAPDGAMRDCHCRKPKPGLLVAAANDLGVDLSVSLMIGDQPTDLAAAQAAGIHRTRTFIVDGAAMDDAAAAALGAAVRRGLDPAAPDVTHA